MTSATRNFHSQTIIFEGGESTDRYVGYSDSPIQTYVLFFYQGDTLASVETIKANGDVKFLCYTDAIRNPELRATLEALR